MWPRNEKDFFTKDVKAQTQKWKNWQIAILKWKISVQQQTNPVDRIKIIGLLNSNMGLLSRIHNGFLQVNRAREKSDGIKVTRQWTNNSQKESPNG